MLMGYDISGSTIARYTINDYTYTGKERDKDSGLYYYGARYYDPEVGIFLTEDPISAIFDTKQYLLNSLDSENYKDLLLSYKSIYHKGLMVSMENNSILEMALQLDITLLSPSILNPYCYAVNNPTNLIEHKGESAAGVIVGIVVVAYITIFAGVVIYYFFFK